MDLSYLYTFKEVVKWGSYTRTGIELGYAQSSVTTQIRKLEEYYQVRLFERSGQKMELTQAGEHLYYYVHQVTQLMDEARVRITRGVQARGTLRIGTVESLAAYFITPHVKKLKNDHPDLRIQLESGICPNLKKGVLNGERDLVVMLDEINEHPALQAIPLKKEEMLMVVHPNHRFAKERYIDMEHLQEETLILTEKGCSYRVMFERMLKNYGVESKSVLTFTSLEAIKQCVIDELGVAVLPEMAVRKEIDRGQLIPVRFEKEHMSLMIQILYLKKKWLSPAIKQFIEFLSEENLRSSQ
ncbi:LysR family transcriptional regulator [Halobacillus salinarum]|uniref:LysR family transcriptional regulator n=1 Tax=Halobacillus salinarum TaxID=2932257 RepID=A0ABY4EQP0_9BACI|nr:LysR family transcriptional regulator [Halobacillus salinarum]UOQ45992.1 LysR family transcriptional regulator [Halobacillus salinarum]